jgi:hypothetical protein
MNELRIIVEIDDEGRITADAEGFSGDACLTDLHELLDGLAPPESVRPKPGGGAPSVTINKDVDLNIKGGL